MSINDRLSPVCQPISVFWGRAVSQGQVDLTPCFEDTAVLLVPCVFLVVLAALQFFVEGRTRGPTLIPLTYLHIFRTVFAVLLALLPLIDLGKSIYHADKDGGDTVAVYQYFSPALFLCTMILAVVLIQWFRNRGVRAAGTLMVFWLLLLIYASLKLRTYILIKQYGVDSLFAGAARDIVFDLVLVSLQFAIVLISFVLSLMPDRVPLYTPVDDELKPCPEAKATFLSQITFWWMNNMIFTGYKRPLTDDDLFGLYPEDKATVVVPQFLSAWRREVEKANRQNANLLQSLGYSSEAASLNASLETMAASRENLATVAITNLEDARIKLKKPSLAKALVKAFGSLMLTGGFFKLTQDLLVFASPQLLKLMINFTRDNEPQWRGYIYACLLFVVAELQSLTLQQYFHRCFRTGVRLKTAVISAVYRKAMRLNNSARKKSTVGEIVNLMAVDAQRFMDLMAYVQLIWSAPLQMVLATFFLWETVGVSVLAGIAVMVLLIPVNAIIAVISRKLQVKQMIFKDQRIKVMNEVLSGIKVIKLYAWEKSFLSSITKIRKKELAVLRTTAYLNAVSAFTWTCAPFMVALATFATYVLTGNSLTSEKAFVALSLFNILRFPLSVLPMLISSMVEAYVSLTRVTKFLMNEELDPDAAIREQRAYVGGDDNLVKVENANFYWSRDERAILHDINLHVKPARLVAVVGQVGAGKSSIISALLGEMEREGGRVHIKGSIAYVAQQAWIQNATVRNNILFGMPYNAQKYGRVIQACALGPDLEILTGGDMTEIGEKGINLSGGQKQRVSLARAVYHNSDIYLLDDPLSAVDSHVGKHIFEQVVGPEGILKDKVRIFVTHGVGYLPVCDQIIVMKNGRISEVGTYGELQASDGAFAEFLRNYAQSGHDEEEEDDEGMINGNVDEDEDEEFPGPTIGDHVGLTSISPLDDMESKAREEVRQRRLERQVSARMDETSQAQSPKVVGRQISRQMSRKKILKQKSMLEKELEKTKLIEKEKAETGNVKFGVYFDYLRALTWIISILTILLFVAQNAASVGSNIWLAKWSDDEDQKALNSSVEIGSIGYYLGVYSGLGFGQGIIVLITTLLMTVGIILAAMTMHQNLLLNILRSPMSFFDTTPLGRIVNRFSKDIYMIDETIPRSLRSFLATFFNVIAIVFIIAYSTPIFLVVMVPLGVLYFFTQRFYVATSRQLKRIESITRSPIYSHFQETLSGTSTIRAYGVTERFIVESETRVDANQTAYYPNVCSNRWLALRLEFVGNCIILFAALFAVIERNRSGLSAGLVGLSISYALQITQTLNWMVRMTSELEANIVSVERVKEYSETPTEAPAIMEQYRPVPGWPNHGKVAFNSYSLRYREGLDLVLKGIDCVIEPCEKVGIVGRTGAGKSSLTLGFFRLVEAAGGSIVVDGIDIACLGLDDLRSRITIIPQDPVLFSGTLRLNLDPFEDHMDDEVWHSLESAHLRGFLESINAGLSYEIAEGGENLSVGQRQLVCLARALLRKTKILVLDEATAAVDLETDDLIQQTIRREFDDCTILTIAHRLNTIMDSDRVVVLDRGRIVEFDSPANLLANRGVFYSMAVDAGLAQ